MSENTLYFDKKSVETSMFLSNFNLEEPENFLNNVFEALDAVNKERRVFSDTLRTYYMNYLNNTQTGGIFETNEIKGLSELLEKTSEGLNPKWKVLPKTVRNWFTYSEYSMTKQNAKIAFFQVAFALGLSREEVRTFFMKLFGGIPAFSRNPVDLIFEYCFANKKSFKDAVSMLEEYESRTVCEYEKAFENAYSDENKLYTHFYASAMNCNGGCFSLFNFLVNSVDDAEQTEQFLRNNNLSLYLSTLIREYERKSGLELNRKALEETASLLVSSKGLENKYIRRESKDNTRIKSWKEGKGNPELTDSFSDRVLMYALIKKTELNKEQISNLILLSAKSKARRFLANNFKDDSIIESIKKYIEAKKDSSLPAACAEDIEIFSTLWSGKKYDINSEKEKFLNTHGDNSIEKLFYLESEDFISDLLKIRLEFAVNNVRAKEYVSKNINYLTETKSGEKFLLTLLNKTPFIEYDDIETIGFSLKQDFWVDAATNYFRNSLNTWDGDSVASYFPWFWVAVTYGFGNSKILIKLFRDASGAAIEEIDNEPWFRLSTGNKFYKEWLLKEYGIFYSDFQKNSEFFNEDSTFWINFKRAVDESNYRISEKKHEDISQFKNTVAEGAFIAYCNREIMNLYKKDMNSIFKKIETDGKSKDYKRFLCSAFKNMPSPSFVEGNHFEAGKGNMYTYEQLRSLLIFLHFFVFQKSKGKTFKDYQFEINALLSECGFSKLYSKEPLDFVFLTCAQSKSPVKSFSVLWNLALND